MTAGVALSVKALAFSRGWTGFEPASSRLRLGGPPDGELHHGCALRSAAAEVTSDLRPAATVELTARRLLLTDLEDALKALSREVCERLWCGVDLVPLLAGGNSRSGT